MSPFAGFKNWASCIQQNKDKDNPEFYCGSIKHKVEKMQKSYLNTLLLKQEKHWCSKHKKWESKLEKCPYNSHSMYPDIQKEMIDKVIKELDNDFISLSKSVVNIIQKQMPPGPPPRPGLQWKPQTHRWIRPEHELWSEVHSSINNITNLDDEELKILVPKAKIHAEGAAKLFRDTKTDPKSTKQEQSYAFSNWNAARKVSDALIHEDNMRSWKRQ